MKDKAVPPRTHQPRVPVARSRGPSGPPPRPPRPRSSGGSCAIAPAGHRRFSPKLRQPVRWTAHRQSESSPLGDSWLKMRTGLCWDKVVPSTPRTWNVMPHPSGFLMLAAWEAVSRSTDLLRHSTVKCSSPLRRTSPTRGVRRMASGAEWGMSKKGSPGSVCRSRSSCSAPQWGQ